jgi:hypothetical protein
MPPGRKIVRRLVLAATCLVLAALLGHRLTATLGVDAARSVLAPAPGQAISGVECRAVFPGVVRCSYFERRSDVAGPKEGGRFYESDYRWYGLGRLRLRHFLSAVS